MFITNTKIQKKFLFVFSNRTYSAGGYNSNERSLSHSAEHTPPGPVTISSLAAGPDADKAATQTNVPEIETSAAPQPDIPNSTSKNPLDNAKSIQDLKEEVNSSCKGPAPCDRNRDETTAWAMPEDDITVNEVTTSYDGISGTVMFARASVIDNVSSDNYPDMNEFQLFRIGRNIQRFFFISIFPLFFFCNIVCLLTMIQKHNRGYSTCVFMAALAVNDNLVMLFSLITWMAAELNIFNLFTPLACSFVVYFSHVLWTLSSYIITTMTYDKMYGIVWPHKSKDKCTAGRARLTCLVVAILAIVFFIPLGFFARLNGNNCIRYSQETWYVTLYAHISMIVHPLLPFASVLTMNSIILFKLCKRKSSGISTSTAIQKAQKQLIIMLLSISSTYLVLTIPFEAREIYLYYVTYANTPEGFAENFFAFAVTHELITVNSGINFFLYLLSGRKFRTDLQILLSA